MTAGLGEAVSSEDSGEMVVLGGVAGLLTLGEGFGVDALGETGGVLALGEDGGVPDLGVGVLLLGVLCWRIMSSSIGGAGSRLSVSIICRSSSVVNSSAFSQT